LIAKVYVSFIDYCTDKLYDYSVPPAFFPRIMIGSRVVVPFGKGNKKIEAVVIACESQSQIQKLKPILSIIDEDAVSKEALDFAGFIKEHYFCTFYEALKLLLPPGAGLKFSEKIYANQQIAVDELDCVQKEIYDFVKSNIGVEPLVLFDKFNNERNTINNLINCGVLISKFFEISRI
jgi:primosomal protein N' (replication factor Y)